MFAWHLHVYIFILYFSFIYSIISFISTRQKYISRVCKNIKKNFYSMRSICIQLLKLWMILIFPDLVIHRVYSRTYVHASSSPLRSRRLVIHFMHVEGMMKWKVKVVSRDRPRFADEIVNEQGRSERIKKKVRWDSRGEGEGFVRD